MPLPGTDLVERDAELDLADALLTTARAGTGALMAVTGHAGLGKTALLDAISARARGRGFQVLRARGAELEVQLAFGVASRLLGRAARDAGVLGDAPGAAQSLLQLRPAGPPEEGEEPFAALNGLYWVCSALAEVAPLALLIDDADWADEASLRFVAFLRERLDDLPIVIALGLRPGVGGALAALVDDPRTVHARLRPVAREHALEVVRARAPAATDAQAEAVFAATDGHPFYLVALADELAVAPGAEPGRIAALAPAAVTRAVLARVAAVGPDAERVARAVAVLGNDAEVRHVAALAGMTADAAAIAADALAQAHVLTTDRPLDFAHPIVRAAVLADLPAGRRAVEHRRAAEVLRDGGAPAHRVAVQLLATHPTGDPAVVGALLTGVEAATGPGGRETAVALLRRALEEPPDQAQRPTVLAALGTAERHLMSPEARAHLEEALQVTEDPAQQLALTLELAAVDEQQGRLPDAVGTLEAVLSRLDAAGADESLRALLAANAAIGRLFGLLPVPTTALDDLEERLSRLDPASWLARMVAGVLAAVHGFGSTRTADRVAAHFRHALGTGLPRELIDRPAALGALPIASSVGLHQLVLEVVDVAAVARLTGSRWATAALATWRAHAAHAAGRLAEAEAEATAGADGFGDDVPVGHAAAVAVLALVVLDRHGPEAAARVLDRLGDEPLAVPPALQGCMVLRARARVGLASHDLAAARSASERLRDMIAEPGLEEPALLGWRRDLALALHRQEAPGAEELALEHLARCDAGGVPAVVADACLVLAETGDPSERGERLERAVTEAERGDRPLVLADALAAQGAHMRRTGAPAAAREPLERALRIFDACGAGGLRGPVHDELAATGVRPARPRDLARHRLTPSELRTARLAADGLTNRDIALALFVTPKTVETHLRSAFRKLDVSSRRELPASLTAT